MINYEDFNGDPTSLVGDVQLNKKIKMNKLKILLNWIVWSSKNSERISVTVKTGIPFLLLLGLGKDTDLNLLSANFDTLLISWAIVVSGLGTIYGASRKIILTLKSWWTNR